MRTLLLCLCLIMAMQANAQPGRLRSYVRYTGPADILQIYDSTQVLYRNDNAYKTLPEDLRKDFPGCDTVSRYHLGLFRTTTTIYYHRGSVIDSIAEYSAVNELRSFWWMTYNAAGDITSHSIINWDPTNLLMDTSHRYIYTYNGGKLESIRQEGYEQGAWLSGGLTSYTYAGANLASVEKGTWNINTGIFTNFDKHGYSYDAVGNMLADTTYQWSDTANAWIPQWLDTYTWDATGHMLLWYHRPWSSFNANWRPFYMTGYSYSAAGNRIADTTDRWDENTAFYQPKSVVNYYYDAAGKSDSTYWLEWSDTTSSYLNYRRQRTTYNIVGLLDYTETVRWDHFKNDWTYYQAPEATRYYYTLMPDDTTTSVNTVQTGEPIVSLYPNPANDFITLKLDNKQSSTIAIYNTTGALLRQWEEKSGSTTRTIPLHSFENGNYVLTVRGADGSKMSRQFVVGR